MNNIIWSVRRELWENRSIWLAPAGLTIVLALAYLAAIGVGAFGLDGQIEPADIPGDFARKASLIFFVSLTALFNIVLLITVARYLLQSLYSDRKDRSILFWRSMPVSDTATVLSKLFVALLVAPLITFAFLLASQLLGAGAMLAGAALFNLDWTFGGLLHLWAFLIIGLLAQSLWYLPFYGWLMMASAWARQAPFLWAVIPPLLAGVVEGILFQSSHFLGWVGSHLQSFLPTGLRTHMETGGKTSLQINPDHVLRLSDLASWLGSAAMWIGVAVGIVFVVLAILLRRYRAEDF